MKIALAVPSLVEGAGIPNVVVAWANRFAAWGHQTAIVTLRNTRTDISPLVEVYIPPTLRRGIRMWLRSAALRRILSYPLLRWLRQRRFDIINVHYTPMDTLLGGVRELLHAKFVYTYYGVSEPTLFSGEAGQRRLSEDKEMRRWLPQCDQIHVVSRFLQERVALAYPSLQSIVITPGIDLEQFKPSSPVVNSDSPRLLYVGRISEHKGVHLLLSAFSIIRQSVPGVHLYIIGKHDNDRYWKSLQPHLIESQAIHYLGTCSQEELVVQYKQATLFVCGSLYEGFGLPFLEAQGCGVPCVGFASASIPEVVLDGETGLLVPPGDTQAFADAAIRLLRDGAFHASMASNARKHAESYSWDALTQKVLGEFERLLACGSSR